MKEYVMTDKEFNKLVKGRTHWIIEKEPLYISDMGGGKVLQTGEHRLILMVSGICKEETKHVIAMKVDFGIHYRNTPEYNDMIKKIEEYAAKHYPNATQGAFE